MSTNIQYQARLYYNPEPVPDSEPFCIWRSPWLFDEEVLRKRLANFETDDEYANRRNFTDEMAKTVCVAEHESPYDNYKGGFTEKFCNTYELLRNKIKEHCVDRNEQDVEISDNVYLLIEAEGNSDE